MNSFGSSESDARRWKIGQSEHNCLSNSQSRALARAQASKLAQTHKCTYCNMASKRSLRRKSLRSLLQEDLRNDAANCGEFFLKLSGHSQSSGRSKPSLIKCEIDWCIGILNLSDINFIRHKDNTISFVKIVLYTVFDHIITAAIRPIYFQ